MGSNREMVAYVPVVHRGYLELFQKFGRDVGGLWVLGLGLLNELSSHREIRSVDPEIISKMIDSLGIFEKVEVLERELLPSLKGRNILMPDEDLSRRLAEKYLGGQSVVFEKVFLRWSESNVTTPQTVRPDRESINPFDRKMMELAEQESLKSSDWWRRIGAVVIKEGRVLLTAHNQHEPSEQTPYVDGDPRDVIDAGTHNLLYSSIHAEQLLVATAAGRGIDLSGSHLYINVFPCPECTKLVSLSRIEKCFFKTGSAWLNSEEVMRSHGIEIVKVAD